MSVRGAAGERTLDFIVIGVQKGGTTSLWQLLRKHPSIAMPERKEEPYFAGADHSPFTLSDYMETHFGDAPEGALLGKATPQYMMGSEHLGVAEIAQRISTALPAVRLIALLRDPIERAFSQYKMLFRRGLEKRTFDAVIMDQLDPERLATERRHVTDKRYTYVIQGEYGRILTAYRDRFPAERLHVEMTEDLGSDPGGVLDRILAFLSLPAGYRPPRLNARSYRGGKKKLLDAESRSSLQEFMAENVWPNLGDEEERVKYLFAAFLWIWDVAPESNPPALSAAVRARLEEHYARDAEILARLGFAAPWLDSWQA